MAAIIAMIVMSIFSVTQQRQLQKKAVKRQEKAAIAAAGIAGEKAGRKSELTVRQMESLMQRSKIQSLTNVFENEDKNGGRVFTLPTAQPTSPVERINRTIGDFLRG